MHRSIATRELLYIHLGAHKDKYGIRVETGPSPVFPLKMCPNSCPACCHYLNMSDELVEALRDANRIFKE
eukprot:3542289-Karenia_brevis.AAC.1